MKKNIYIPINTYNSECYTATFGYWRLTDLQRWFPATYEVGRPSKTGIFDS